MERGREREGERERGTEGQRNPGRQGERERGKGTGGRVREREEERVIEIENDSFTYMDYWIFAVIIQENIRFRRWHILLFI